MPTLIIPDKICSHCGGTEWYYYKKKNTYCCRNKQKEEQKAYASTPEGKAKLKAGRDKYRLNNKNNEKQHYKDYYAKNKETYKINSHKYRKTEKGKNALKRAKNKQSENLTDYYIVNTYYINLYVSEGIKINRKDVTQEQIEIQRKKLLLTRQLKNHEGKDYTLY